MNRLCRVVVLLSVALGVVVALAPAPVDPIGRVIVIPTSGNDLVAIPVVVVTLTLIAVAVANRLRKRCSS